MSSFFSLLYLTSLLSFLPPLAIAWYHWRVSQPPLGKRFITLNLSIGAFLTAIAASYFSFGLWPASTGAIELFFSTAFFVLYASMALSFPAFLSEIVQVPWKEPMKDWIVYFAALGAVIPLAVDALIWDGPARVESLRSWLNSVYLPAFLLVVGAFFVRALARRGQVSDPWKRRTATGAAVVFFLGIPAFVIDALWPLFQVEWQLLPRGANLHVFVVLAWNIFFTWRWAIFSGGPLPAPDALPTVEDPRGVLLSLSSREKEVALLLLRGYNNQAVAAELGIKLGTAKIHVYRIFNKTGASSRKEFSRMLQV